MFSLQPKYAAKLNNLLVNQQTKYSHFDQCLVWNCGIYKLINIKVKISLKSEPVKISSNK